MEKSSLVRKLLGKKKDYTYTIVFFLVFSFFTFFVIRPNLLTVFEAHAKIDQLNKVNAQYEEQIKKIIELQVFFETNRDQLIHLNESIPATPQVSKVIADINLVIEEMELESDRIEVAETKLKEKTKKQSLQPVSLNVNLKSSFENALAFIKRIYGQRRLKEIKDLTIQRESSSSTQSAELRLNLKVDGFYL
ncbi:type 4a pilus biogenesis protein PilO [Candidatus Roizmanbacteria bacterium]|nr:type 4a pilus biogenesis protein PilO [Candidatus Roizmanbacteria bacterium]